jgi:hypothetical protein
VSKDFKVTQRPQVLVLLCSNVMKWYTWLSWKGSIFVELESATSCATLLRNSKALDYQGAELIVMTKTRYLEKKKGTTPL